jgi:hypothetical protein
VGLGALLSGWLADVALWMLLAGAAAHAWGMYDKNRIERDVGGPNVWWHIYAYWLCWILLAAGAVLIATRTLS